MEIIGNFIVDFWCKRVTTSTSFHNWQNSVTKTHDCTAIIYLRLLYIKKLQKTKR